MKRFEQYEDILAELDFDKYDREYAMNKLSDFLECEGSTVVTDPMDEPNSIFILEKNQETYEIGVTSIEVEDDTFKYYYWLSL